MTAIGEPSVTDVIAVAAQLFAVPAGDLTGRDKHEPLNTYRKAAMAACRLATTASYPTIGRHFDFRDHSTAMHAVNSPDRRVLTWAKQIAAIARVDRAIFDHQHQETA